MIQQPKSAKGQAGFTLVELAIVMIIIGLLIGGVLKGQELINNAQITSTVAQIKSFESATTSFKDMYQGVPGDIANAVNRIPNCPAAGPACSPAAANGNGRIDNAGAALTFGVAPAPEQIAAWLQLNAANLITGINPNAPAIATWGGEYPAGKITGTGYDIGYSNGGVGPAGLVATNAVAPVRSGHWLALHGSANTLVGGAADLVLTPSQAFRIDAKLDDGVPAAGSVLAAGGAPGANACFSTATAAAIYNEAAQGGLCALYLQAGF